MGNCGSGSGRPGKQEDIVDIEKIIIGIARQKVSRGDLTFTEKLCLEKSIYLEVRVNFIIA